MKRIFLILFFIINILLVKAQDYIPTVNWPYVNPDFYQGEARKTDNSIYRARFNIHLGQGRLHMVDNDGIIGEIFIDDLLSVQIANKEYLNIGGKLLRILERSDNGYIVEETLANYSAVARRDGAFGSGNANSSQSFSYDENYGNYSHLLTNVYDDLYSQKEYGEELPIIVNHYLVFNGILTTATKKSVEKIDGIDKRAFATFLKSEKINWKDPQDLLKIIDFIATSLN